MAVAVSLLTFENSHLKPIVEDAHFPRTAGSKTLRDSWTF